MLEPNADNLAAKMEDIRENKAWLANEEADGLSTSTLPDTPISQSSIGGICDEIEQEIQVMQKSWEHFPEAFDTLVAEYRAMLTTQWVNEEENVAPITEPVEGINVELGVGDVSPKPSRAKPRAKVANELP